MKNASQSVTAYIGVGSNLGNPVEHVKRALAALASLPDTTLEQQSSLFRTTPIDASGEDFINTVVKLQTQLNAHDLLRELQRIESDFGRERPYVNAPRTLDLDILLYGSQRIASPDLVIPHPRLTQRAFALIPLLQLDPFIQIPGAGLAHSFVPNVSGQPISKIMV
ncbi:MAG: 2-amino-4-hydroxy-6-hydroxymethyldihydropteridine diphosphokinase [Oxalobacter sp.]|nr:MAG: 2-amino-4-hydroxy-6-hydroxymethyldihydropteridine diphosphokinase [Oxalobacter sp.]